LSKAKIFSINKPFGGGILPIIGKSYAAAYEVDNRIIVVPFKNEDPTYYSSPLTSSIDEHIQKTFDAQNIAFSTNDVGSCIASVWRPGRTTYDDISVDVKLNENLRSDKQALLLLVTKLSEIFLTIEPTPNSLSTYGHKIRELHLLACMEVENYLKDYLNEGMTAPPNRPTTNDYVKLASPLYLGEYNVDLLQFPDVPNIFPFRSWDKSEPTKSLTWYDNYNKSKHNRRENFGCSTLGSAIDSVAAVVVLFTVRYGMHQLTEKTDILSLQVSQIMRIFICNSDMTSWYVPKIRTEESVNSPISEYIRGLEIWNRVPLKL
jgi:hypothetical protein